MQVGRLVVLQDCAFVFGRSNALDTGLNPAEACRAFEGFSLNGMPCDRVNMVTAEGPDALTWQETTDVHSAYWPHHPELYRFLRLTVMRGMLAANAVGIRTLDENS